MGRLVTRRRLVILLGVMSVVVVGLGTLWQSAIKKNRSIPRESASATDPVEAFIDPAGYLSFIEGEVAQFGAALAKQRGDPTGG